MTQAIAQRDLEMYIITQSGTDNSTDSNDYTSPCLLQTPTPEMSQLVDKLENCELWFQVSFAKLIIKM